MWQLLSKLYLLPWVVVVFSSKASKSCALPFDLRGSCPVSRPTEAVVCSAASWSKAFVLPTVFCGRWMESVCVETTAHGRKKVWHGISNKWANASKFIYQKTNARKSKDTGFTLHISSWLHSFFLSGSRTPCCLFRSHSFSMGQKGNTVVRTQILLWTEKWKIAA